MKLEKTKDLLIFGGSFNPPTVQHEQILNSASKFAADQDLELILLPSGDRSDKSINVGRSTRLELISAMIDDCQLSGPITIDTRELDDDQLTKTHRTVLALQSEYPNLAQTWIFGADSIKTMPTWEKYKWIIQNIQILAVERTGYNLDPSITRLPIISALDLKISDISSSEVRRLLKDRQDFGEFVGKNVLKYLSKNPDLYD